jgi:chitin disaccharide deacetylase
VAPVLVRHGPLQTVGGFVNVWLAAVTSSFDKERGTMQRLIVIADDFGASPAVNAAVVQAHRRGILTAASLMVNEAAFDEAVRLAHATPTLAVGLHLAISLSRASLPASRIPALVNAEGKFSASSPRAGLRYQFSRQARAELEDEIRAQLDRFRGTGLALDHVTGHQHMHMHPQVLSILLRCAPEYGIPALRVVRDDLARNLRLDFRRFAYKLSHWVIFGTLACHAARRVRAAGLTTADRVWGLYQDGRMTRSHLLALLCELPDGVTEIYAHPATAPGADPRRVPTEELAALVDPSVRALIAAKDIALTSYAALAESSRLGTAGI